VATVLALIAITWCVAPAVARAGSQADDGPHAALAAAFSPLRLGASTTISFAVRIDPAGEAVPIPISAVEVSYPADLGLATSQLGLESCGPAALALQGPQACPADSRMGQGSAIVGVPFGPEAVHERVVLGIYAAPSSDGYVHLAIVAEGTYPVIARIVLAGVLLPGRLQISIPPIASLPGAPYASVISMRASLGGALTYYEDVHGRTVAYRPRGIGLPESCPRGGWRLGASFAFIDGQSSHAATVIACPHGGARATSRSAGARQTR
jgi:hypothetical protein